MKKINFILIVPLFCTLGFLSAGPSHIGDRLRRPVIQKGDSTICIKRGHAMQVVNALPVTMNPYVLDKKDTSFYVSHARALVSSCLRCGKTSIDTVVDKRIIWTKK